MRNAIYDLEHRLTTTNKVDESAELALECYLSERAKWLELDMAFFRNKEDFQFVLRLACTIRIFDPRIASQLRQAFYELEPAQQTLLTDQLGFDRVKGINSFARTPHYVATAAQNSSRQAFKLMTLIKR